MGFLKRVLLENILPFITSNLGTVKRLILKRLLPFLAANTLLDVDTLEKGGAYSLRVRVESLGYKIIDHKIPIGSGIIDEVVSFGGVLLDVDTVRKSDGLFLRVRVEVLGRLILDRYIPVASLDAAEFEPVDILDIPAEMREQLQPGKNVLGGLPFN